MLNTRFYKDEEDYWRIRNFLRQVFVLNQRLEHSWSVPRLDYWRWHFVENLHACDALETAVSIWETEKGEITAVLLPLSIDEIRLFVHPCHRTLALENEILEVAENNLARPDREGSRRIVCPAFTDDHIRQEALRSHGFVKGQNSANHWRRDLVGRLPVVPPLAGYTIRCMGGEEEHPSRSLASWRSFHSGEGDDAYDGDHSWFANLQRAPLYRRDLDLVASTQTAQIAAFCTIYYDDCTRSAVSVLVGTDAQHQRKGLGKALMFEGMRRAQNLGCTRFFATAYDPPADALYGSIMQHKQVSETWIKEL